MDYKEMSDFLDTKYYTFGWITTQYIIFKEENIIKYLNKYHYLDDDEQRDDKVLVYYNEKYYLSRKFWAKLIFNKPKDEVKRIINEINNL